jgi:serine/threonine protein kinase
VAKVRLLDPNDAKRRLDRYELIGELASGGMATVFLGRLGGVGGFQRFVAIKRLHPHLASEEEFIEMFLDEARLAAGIHHPHVVPILEVGESDSGYYLVMEYIEGDTLARLMARALARAQPIPRPVLIRIVLDALAGLHAAHELLDAQGNPVKLVHRDVSPQNVLVGVDGCSRITDFGVAHAASRLQNTRADRLKGKLAYMSPEQARAGEVDQRADVFAMGIILWEVLAAKRLFKGENEAVTLHRVTSEPIPRLSSMVPGLHPALDQVSAKALERDPANRYFTAADMAEALERAARAAANASATDLGVASPREVAAYVQGALGDDIAAQRESVRAWLAHSEPSMPRLGGVKPAETSKPPGYDVTMKMPLDREAAAEIRSQPRSPRRMGSQPGVPTLISEQGRPAGISSVYDANLLGKPGAAPLGSLAAPQAVSFFPTGAAPALPLDQSSRSFSLGEASKPPAQPRTIGSAPNVREALGIQGGSSPGLTIDGAAADEAPVEPVDDDDDEHETLLMDREAGAAELEALLRGKPSPAAAAAARLQAMQTPHASSAVPARGAGIPAVPRAHVAPASHHPPALSSGPFPEDGTPSKSIESFMVPAAPPPSRTPQLVALGMALLIGVGGFVMWWQLRVEGGPDQHPATGGTATATVAPLVPVASAATVPASPSTTPTAAPSQRPSAEATPPPVATPTAPTAVVPSGDGRQPLRGKGPMPRGKGTAPVAPPPTAQPAQVTPPPPPPPAETKPPEDMPNPYR